MGNDGLGNSAQPGELTQKRGKKIGQGLSEVKYTGVGG